MASAPNPKFIRRLQKVGNTFAVFLDPAVVSLLSITPEMDFELTTDGQSLRCRPLEKDEAPQQSLLVKHTTKFGGSTALYLDKVLLAILGIAPEKDDVEVLTDGKALLVRPARADIRRAEAIADAIDKITLSPLVFSGSGEASTVAKGKAKGKGRTA